MCICTYIYLKYLKLSSPPEMLFLKIHYFVDIEHVLPSECSNKI